MTVEQYSLNFSREMKNAGIQKALDSAKQIDANWEEKAFNYLLAFVNSRKPNETFKCEDVRANAETMVPEPYSKRAWGGIMKRAIAQGIIKKVGIVSVGNPKAHGANANLYIRHI
jgi:hypothetical protein